MSFTDLLNEENIINFLVYINWSKMALGLVLMIIGIPPPFLTNEEKLMGIKGRSIVDAGKLEIFLRKSQRFTIIVSELILITAAILEGYEGFNRDKKLNEEYAVKPLTNSLLSK
jgi:hypothetical protein